MNVDQQVTQEDQQTGLRISLLNKPIRGNSMKSLNDFVSREEELQLAISKEEIPFQNQDQKKEIEICLVLKFFLVRNLYTQIFTLICSLLITNRKLLFPNELLIGSIFLVTQELFYGLFHFSFYKQVKNRHSV